MEPTSNAESSQAALAVLSRAGLHLAGDARRTNTSIVLERNGKCYAKARKSICASAVIRP